MIEPLVASGLVLGLDPSIDPRNVAQALELVLGLPFDALSPDGNPRILFAGLLGGIGGAISSGLSKFFSNPKDVLGALSLLGSSFLEQKKGKEQAAAARAEQARLEKERQALEVRQRRADERSDQEQSREVGAMRARLAASGVDIRKGSARRLLSLANRRFEQDEQDEEELQLLERQGLASAIGSAGRAASSARSIGNLNALLALTRGF